MVELQDRPSYRGRLALFLHGVLKAYATQYDIAFIDQGKYPVTIDNHIRNEFPFVTQEKLFVSYTSDGYICVTDV